MGKYSLCVPARYGAATGAAVGLIVWALVAYVPAFHNGVPEPVVAFLPFALAFIGHTAATWIAPHPAVAAPAAAVTLPDSGRGGSPAGTTGVSGQPASAAPFSSATVKIVPPAPAAGSTGTSPSAAPQPGRRRR